MTHYITYMSMTGNTYTQKFTELFAFANRLEELLNDRFIVQRSICFKSEEK